ncbi:MAG TPA: DUF4230 domain-containing protein [Candidatus Ventrimonas merdavium]|nr:DUF4230 domain-containing protein [Candidatus Ventrimonas merdavium]
MAKWEGTIKAGIEITDITAEVDETNKVITVYLPKAKILSHEIDDESFETLDEKAGLFNPIEVFVKIISGKYRIGSTNAVIDAR